jgi:hypothetical protein
MGEYLLQSPWFYLYLLYVTALVVVNIIHATTPQQEPTGNTSLVGVETKSANGSRNRAA